MACGEVATVGVAAALRKRKPRARSGRHARAARPAAAPRCLAKNQ
jgi:hypothetical protein